MTFATAGLYLHVPFCQSRCVYCDFYSTTCGPAERGRYVEALCRELEARADEVPGRRLATVYLGGGTPSQLSPAELERVFSAVGRLFRLAPEGELMYDENTYTDQDLEFRISEIIREKTMATLSDELPHTIYVEIEDMEYSEESQEVWIRAVINTEREGQKGIIVGRGGENIKRIRKESFKEIRRIFPGSKLTLDLRVKADPKWRSSDKVLGRIFR